MQKKMAISWKGLIKTALECHESVFTKELFEQKIKKGVKSAMGRMDASYLYTLVRWIKPKTVIETGGYVGMSSTFILKAFKDEGLTDSKIYSIEALDNCGHGSIIPKDLKENFIPVSGKVEKLIKQKALPEEIDFFLHDSSHRYKHMLMEYKHFWNCLTPGGILASHDTHLSSAFTTFVSKTYKHDKIGQTDFERTSHIQWAKWGNLGFVWKK